jgi:hypothetical protein
MLLSISRPSKGAEIVVTMTGAVTNGYDLFPIFGVGTKIPGSNGNDIGRQPFTLVYTFDDTKGHPNPKPPCPNVTSGITGDYSESPGIVVFTIHGVSYTIGTRKDTHSGAWRSIAGPCSTALFIFTVRESSGYVDPGNGVSVRIAPAPGDESLVKSADWRSPVNLVGVSSTGEFEITGKRVDYIHETAGKLNVQTLKIEAKR